jgi:O-antigen ligase
MPLVPAGFPLVLVGALSAVPMGWWDAIGESARQLASLSNRETIWRAVFAELLAFKPIHLVGFGAYGHIASGLSEAYSHFFTAWIRSDLASAHNAVLQAILEVGYIGAAILMGAMAVALARLAAPEAAPSSRGAAWALAGLLVFLAMAGSTESSWSPLQQELQALLLFALAAAALAGPPAGAGAAGEAVLESGSQRQGAPPAEHLVGETRTVQVRAARRVATERPASALSAPTITFAKARTAGPPGAPANGPGRVGQGRAG